MHIEDWVNGVQQTQGSTDTVAVNLNASDGYPIVLGLDLRNEPHTVCSRRGCDYLGGSTWGTGDGIDPKHQSQSKSVLARVHQFLHLPRLAAGCRASR